MATATGQKVWSRKFLRDQGYKDDDIGFDGTRNMVTLQGKDFYGATPESDGNTYGDQGQLHSALTNYRTTQRNANLDKIASSLVQKTEAPPTQFKAPTPFSYDPNTDPVYHSQAAQIRNDTQTASNNTLARLRAGGQGKSSFSEGVAQQFAQKAEGDIRNQVMLPLMNQAYQRYNDTANRDYQVQRDNYGAEQDQYRNLASLVPMLSGLSQQDTDNLFRQGQADEQVRQGRISLAQWLTNSFGVNAVPKEDAGVAFDQVAGMQPLNRQQFDAGQDQNALANAWRTVQELGYVPEGLASALGLPAGSQTLQSRQVNASIANSNADNTRSAGADERAGTNARIGQLMDVWKATGVAPEGIPGVQPGTALYDQVGSRPNQPSQTDQTREFEAEVTTNLDAMTPEMQKRVLTEEKENIIKRLGRSGYQAIYNIYFDKYGDPITR